jgi:hypothetical protein
MTCLGVAQCDDAGDFAGLRNRHESQQGAIVPSDNKKVIIPFALGL